MKLNAHNQGAVLILAMMFVAIFGALAATMGMMSQGNLQSATTYQESNRAMAAAETGIRFANYRIALYAKNIMTTQGEIDATGAEVLWQTLGQNIITMGNETHMLSSTETTYDNGNIAKIALGQIAVGTQTNAPIFELSFQPHPLPNNPDGSSPYSAAYYQRAPYNTNDGTNPFTSDGLAVSNVNPVQPWWIRITSIGNDQNVERIVQMDFRINKKIRYAVLSRNRIMIGRNVIIDGDIGSRFMNVDYTHGHPVQMRNNFYGLDPALDTQLDTLESYLQANDIDGDNRIQLAYAAESGSLPPLTPPATTYDVNNDGYYDTLDAFTNFYDTTADGNISMEEFSPDGQIVDWQLWELINEAKYPAGTEIDWDTMQIKLPSDATWSDASADLNVINCDDDYAKIHGKISMTACKSDWESGAADGSFQKFYKGPIIPDGYDDPTTFSVPDSDMGQFSSMDFENAVTALKPAPGDTLTFDVQVTNAVPNHDESSALYTPPGSATRESIPYNSPYPYDHYERPVYENYTFRDVVIPKGTNALFVNCKFIGVTFVETSTDNYDPNFNFVGMQESTGEQKYANITAYVMNDAGEMVQVSDTKPYANNLRFDNCDFEGVVATESPYAYTHARNKLQFTGTTSFDIEADSLTTAEKEQFKKSTILAPQYSIDIGTFTDPTNDSESIELEGALVAGVLDVRGSAQINGSIITTFQPEVGEGPLMDGGNPANFNTTIGYFESTAGDAEAEMPEGGYGKIMIRYDPNRSLPDGINGPIEVKPELQTYREGND